MKQNRLLALVVVLQGLMLLGQWVGTPSLPRAEAQVPDAGAQRVHMIEELKSLNSRMDKLIAILESGNLQVKVVATDEKAGGRSR